MLIFVKVYKTIDKNIEIIIRFWKNKREQMNQQKGSLKRLKITAPEVKSAPEVMTSSEASSSEAEDHQKL